MTRIRTLLLATALAVSAAYANHWNNGFHFDDAHAVLNNTWLRSLRNIPRFFTDATTFSSLPANRTWRPIVSTTLAIDYALGHGYVPFWFQLSTFLFFLAQLGAMFLLFRELLSRTSLEAPADRIALFATALYGLHPAIAETVNYVIQRADVYVALGIVAALAIVALRPKQWWLFVLPFVFALLSKPTAAIFPLLLLVYALYFEPKLPRKPLIASVIVLAILLWLSARATPPSFTPVTTNPWAYRAMQPYVWLRYFAQFFLPLHLNVDSDLAAEVSVGAVAGFVFVIALVAAIVLLSRRPRLKPISFGLAWFAIAQLPTSVYALSELENDHRMYLSFVGLALAASWAAYLIVRIYRLQLACAVLIAYGVGTFQRNRVWRDDLSLWGDAVAKSPRNGRGLMNYGLVWMGRGDYQKANELFTRALEFTPNYPTLEVNLGIVDDMLGQWAEAERHFKRAEVLAPRSSDSHFFYARALYRNHRLSEARGEAAIALGFDPHREDARKLLLEIDAGVQPHLAREEALKAAQREVALHQNDAQAWNRMSGALLLLNRFDEAAGAARRALELDPSLESAKANLAAATSHRSP